MNVPCYGIRALNKFRNHKSINQSILTASLILPLVTRVHGHANGYHYDQRGNGNGHVEVERRHFLVPEELGLPLGLILMLGQLIVGRQWGNYPGGNWWGCREQTRLNVLSEVGQEGFGLFQLVVACGSEEIMSTLHNHVRTG